MVHVAMLVAFGLSLLTRRSLRSHKAQWLSEACRQASEGYAHPTLFQNGTMPFTQRAAHTLY